MSTNPSESLAAIAARLFERNDELIVGRQAAEREIIRLRRALKTWREIALGLASELARKEPTNDGNN